MSQDIMNDNIIFLRGCNLNLFNEKDLNEYLFHFVANSLADINYTLTTSDILFKFSLKFDRDLDNFKLGIMTTDNILFEYLISNDNQSYGRILSFRVLKLSIKSIQPVYEDYNQSTEYNQIRNKNLDYLFLFFFEINEQIKLESHNLKSNKSLREISRELLQRL